MDIEERTKGELKAAFHWVDGHADVWGMFEHPDVLRRVGPCMATPFLDAGITAVLPVESRGFLLGPLVAMQLSARLVPVRKGDGLLPGPKVHRAASGDYRGRTPTLRMQRDRLGPTDRVLLVDDWAETGSQLLAVANIAQARGATVIGTSLLVDELPTPTPQVLGLVCSLLQAAELAGNDETRV